MFYSKHFNIGRVYMTVGIKAAMENNEQFVQQIFDSLKRYCKMDWGELCEEDKQANDLALENPDDIYILGAYETCNGKIYIITNRVSEEVGKNQINATTVLFPEER